MGDLMTLAFEGAKAASRGWKRRFRDRITMKRTRVSKPGAAIQVDRIELTPEQHEGLTTGVSSLDPAGDWMAKVRAWAASHPQREHVADDSRKAIYGDRV